MRTAHRGALALMLGLAGCETHPVTPSPPPPAPASHLAADSVEPPLMAVAPDFGEDILSTELALDLENHTGRAAIAFVPPPSGVASFEVGDLQIDAVTEKRAPARFFASKGRLDVDMRRGMRGTRTIEVAYAFRPHEHFDGWEPKEELTFLWPRFCGNLFPCKSDPSDGLTFALSVTGVPKGETAIYPVRIVNDAPSYMPAIVVGALTRTELGTTTAGTKVSV